jgi:hypothetical protein
VTDFAAIFARLPRLENGSCGNERLFSVEGIPHSRSQYVGRSVEGRPVFLVEAHAAGRAPILLQNLRVMFGTQCALSLAGQSRSVSAVVVECLSDVPELQSYFLSTAGSALESLGDVVSPDELVTAVDALVSLFQKLSRPPRRHAQGLFGELFVIEQSRDAAALVQSWHTDPMERFDFAIGVVRLEVKTTATRRRRHEFSLEQCFPPAGTSGIVVSMFVETSGGGVSIRELMERVQSRIADRPELVTKLYAEVVDTLGAGLREGLDERFDEQLAQESLAIYDLASIPAIRVELPNEISRVRFVSDIGGVEPLDGSALRERFPQLGLHADSFADQPSIRPPRRAD